MPGNLVVRGFGGAFVVLGGLSPGAIVTPQASLVTRGMGLSPSLVTRGLAGTAISIPTTASLVTRGLGVTPSFVTRGLHSTVSGDGTGPPIFRVSVVPLAPSRIIVEPR